MNVKKLREERAALRKRMEDFDAEIGESLWSDEQRAQWEQWSKDISALDGRIVRMEQLSVEAPAITRNDTKPFEANPPSPEQREELTDDDRKVLEHLEFRTWLSNGTDLEGRVRKTYILKGAFRGEMGAKSNLHAQVRNLARRGNDVAKGFLAQEQRVQVVGTNNLGGFTVADEMMRPLEVAQRRFNSVMEAGVTVMTTATGAPLPIPTANDTTNEAEIVAESGAVGAQDVLYDQVVLGAYKYTTKAILTSLEFLQDTSIDVEAYLARVAGERFGRGQGKHYTGGNGTTQPQGVVTGAVAGVNKARGTNTISYDDIVDLMTSVDPAYQFDARWMFNQKTLGTLLKIGGNNNQPVWFPSSAPEIPPSLMGRQYIVNDFMPDIGNGARPILYGDFSNYFVRQAMDMEMFRLNERYIENGQMGVVGFSRVDAKLVDAGGNPVKCLVIAN